MFEIEHDFACPYCGAPITMLLDPSIPRQRYVEDCEVCCNPIEIAYELAEEAVVAFEARSIEQ
ncbi:MAG: CPXCG motif-containing cysteine-rich protein [Bacteroidota bacterium]